MVAQIEVGIGNVCAVPDILYIPQLAIEGVSNLAKHLSELTSFTILVGRLGSRYSGDQKQPILSQLFNGLELSAFALHFLVRYEKGFRSSNALGIPSDWVNVLMEFSQGLRRTVVVKQVTRVE